MMVKKTCGGHIPRIAIGILAFVIVIGALVITNMVVLVNAYEMPVIDGQFTTPTEWSDATKYDDTHQGGYVYVKNNATLKSGYPDNYTAIMHDFTINTIDNTGSGSTDYKAGDYNYFPIYADKCAGTLAWEVYIIANYNAPEYPGKLYKIVNGNRIDVTTDPLYHFKAKAGFGSSPNKATPHRMYEFEAYNLTGWIDVQDFAIQFSNLTSYNCVPSPPTIPTPTPTPTSTPTGTGTGTPPPPPPPVPEVSTTALTGLGLVALFALFIVVRRNK